MLTHEFFSFLLLSATMTTKDYTINKASFYLYPQPTSGQSRVYQVTQLPTNGVHCRESAGTGAGQCSSLQGGLSNGCAIEIVSEATRVLINRIWAPILLVIS